MQLVKVVQEGHSENEESEETVPITKESNFQKSNPVLREVQSE